MRWRIIKSTLKSTRMRLLSRQLTRNIQGKANDLEEKKKLYYEEEKEAQNRVKMLQEKEFYLKNKFEEFEIIHKEVRQKETMLSKEKYEITQAAKRLERNLAIFEEKSKLLENEKEQLKVIYRDLELKQNDCQRIELNLQQQKQDFKMRITNVDLMRSKYLTGSSFGDKPNRSFAQEGNKSQTGFRTGFSSAEYINRLKGKFSQSRTDFETRSNFNSYINKEKEYVNKINEEMFGNYYSEAENRLKKELDGQEYKKSAESFYMFKKEAEEERNDLYRESGKIYLYVDKSEALVKERNEFLKTTENVVEKAEENVVEKAEESVVEKAKEKVVEKPKGLSQNNFVKKQEKKAFKEVIDDDFAF